MRMVSCLAALALGVPGAASASSIVIGGGLARSCYEAAELERTSQASLDLCNRALSEEALSYKDRVATYVNRGIVRARSSDWAGALSDYDRAIKLDGAEPEAYLNKASLLLRQEQWARARDMFGLAIERNTKRPELAYFGRAVAAEMAGDLAGAYADYQRASQVAPQWEEPKKELARFTVRKPA
jgi:tetratricopeptide (TPR) repeat protein